MMKCPDCKTVTMEVSLIDVNKARDEFEIVYKCLKCKAVFFGTMYRDLNQATGIVDCEKCEERYNESTLEKKGHDRGA